MSRKYILMSVPDKFMNKFANLVSNINILNDKTVDVKIEKIFNDDEHPKYVATPKKE